MIKLKVFNSKIPNESQELEIAPEEMINGEYFIGRSPKCAIVLSSPEVSRVHGSIGIEGGEYYFSDLASLGGSRLNDHTVKVNQKYFLRVDDIIRIGEFVLLVQAIASKENQTTSNGVTTAVKEAEGTQATTQREAPIISISRGSQKPKEPALDPNQYMPVALISAEQMSRWSKGDLTVRCKEVIHETEDVKTFRFVADPPVLFTYKPGQFLTLNLEINGKPVKRSYSISSTPSRPHTLEISVKRVSAPPDSPDIPPGLVSNWLQDNLKVGSEIKLNGPSGKFTCFANPNQKMLMVSAGSGITPMMSMARWLLDTASDCDIVFVHCTRSPKDIIFRQELELMSSRQPKFRLAFTITRSEPNQPWYGFTGRVTENMLYAIAPDLWERTIYVCGPNGFMQGVKTMLQGLGFPMENHYEESFGGLRKGQGDKETKGQGEVTYKISPSTPALPAPSASTVTLVFAKSSKEVSSDRQDCILNISEEAGIEINSSCRSGSCGTCKQKKLEGEVKYEGEPSALDDSEQEEGYILTCIARPIGRVVIDA